MERDKTDLAGAGWRTADGPALPRPGRREIAMRSGGRLVLDRPDDRGEDRAAGAAADQVGQDAADAEIAAHRRRADRREQDRDELAEHAAAYEPGNRVAQGSEVETGAGLAGRIAADRTGD